MSDADKILMMESYIEQLENVLRSNLDSAGYLPNGSRLDDQPPLFRGIMAYAEWKRSRPDFRWHEHFTDYYEIMNGYGSVVMTVPSSVCTDWCARWCPNHGTCSCDEREDGERIPEVFSDCPLHATNSLHAE